MPDQAYRIRVMARDEVGIALDLARQEGWNPGQYDSHAFYEADPEGFLAGELNGEIIGTISAVRYGGNFGFVGLYIVKAPYRGQGCGIALWREAMQRLAGRVIGLDGVVAQQNNYRRSGFELAYNHLRFAGKAAAFPGNDTASLQVSDFPALCRYDQSIFNADRCRFLQAFAFAPGTAGRILKSRSGAIAGYALMRRCIEGHKIGPVFAPDVADAADLIAGLLQTLPPGENFYLDVPESNPAAIALAKRRLRMTKVFETARMYAHGDWPLPTQFIWGTTTLELG